MQTIPLFTHSIILSLTHSIILSFTHLFILSLITVILIAYIVWLKRKLKKIEKKHAIDILETNKLLIERSENDLKLLFEIEGVSEEVLKRLNKIDIILNKIDKTTSDNKLLSEYLTKK
jgi:hypothetical protein